MSTASRRQAKKAHNVKLKAAARERRIKSVEKLTGKRWIGR